MIRSRKDCLGGRACEPATIAEALHCLIEHSALDVAALAMAVNAHDDDVHVSRAYLYELANPHRPDRGIRTLAVAAALTTVTRRGVLLQFLCRAQGGAFVQLPAGVDAGASDEARLAADALREFSQAMEAFADGAADRSWSPDEVARLEREGHEAIEAVLRAVAHARRRALPARAAGMVKAAPARAAAQQQGTR